MSHKSLRSKHNKDLPLLFMRCYLYTALIFLNMIILFLKDMKLKSEFPKELKA